MATWGNTVTGVGLQNYGADTALGFQFTTPADMGSVIDIKASMAKDASGLHFKGLITNTSGVLVANGIGGASGVINAKAWYTSTFATKPILLPSTAYILWLMQEGWLLAYQSDTEVNSKIATNSTYATPGNLTIGDGGGHEMSIYADYDPPTVLGVASDKIKKLFILRMN